MVSLSQACYGQTFFHGQTFYTAAFRVACDLGSKEKLFDPMIWPQDTEVREWVFKS